MTGDDLDRHMMAIALRMAQRGLGASAPNPAVGAVIADPETGEVIARGWTQPGGRPHAETEALRRAGTRARGATMCVTLEPCAHHGVTPPCADALIAAGIGRVVIGTGDPDPRTAGDGIARLEGADIPVVTGVREADARRMALGHILRVTARRPSVQVKLAVDAAGQVPRGAGGRPRWATGEAARGLGHMLRAEADAILVGSRTVRDDDPELTCRLPGLGHRSPLRVVLARGLDMPLTAKVVATARQPPVLVFAGPDADPAQRTALEARGVAVATVAAGVRGLDIAAALAALAKRGITRLLLEGGPTVWRSFADAGFIDEAVLFQAAAADPSPAAETILTTFVPTPALTLADSRRIGDDRLFFFRRT